MFFEILPNAVLGLVFVLSAGWMLRLSMARYREFKRYHQRRYGPRPARKGAEWSEPFEDWYNRNVLNRAWK